MYKRQSYSDKLKEIEKGRLEKYKVTVQIKCVVLKIKALWNSSENNLYGNRSDYEFPDLQSVFQEKGKLAAYPG